MNNIEIYECGTDVTVKEVNIKGVITGACIRYGRVTYEVSYFFNGDQKSPWLVEDQFTTEGKKGSVGFKNGNGAS